MTNLTPNLGLPVIAAAQAQKHVTHNEALRLLDTLVQLAVLDRDLSSPPGTPSDGECWIVGPSPAGAWAGHAGNIAAWQDGAWQFLSPQVGWLAFVADEGLLVVWNGSAWGGVTTSIGTLQNLALLGVGTTADATNPFSAKLNNALWVAKTVGEGGDGDLRYKMSKESAADTLSLLMQTNFSGRAEIGLIGNDDLSIKVSDDGSTWTEGLVIDRATGGVRFLANEASVASAATCDIGAAAGLKIEITGTTAITSFGSVANAVRLVRFAGALTLTHNATSLILPGAADIVTAAGDTLIAASDASGNWRVWGYQRASGNSIIGGLAGQEFSLTDDSAGTFTPQLPTIGAAVIDIHPLLPPTATRPWGSFHYRSNVAQAPRLWFQDETNVEGSATSLSGTTGTDGKFTIGNPGTGTIYFENRLGATFAFVATVRNRRP